MTPIETELRAKLEQLAADYADAERRAAGAIRDRTIDRARAREHLVVLTRIENALGSRCTGDLALDVERIAASEAAAVTRIVGHIASLDGDVERERDAIRAALGSRATDDLPADVERLVEELADALGTCCDWNGQGGKHNTDCAHGVALVRAERAEAEAGAHLAALRDLRAAWLDGHGFDGVGAIEVADAYLASVGGPVPTAEYDAGNHRHVLAAALAHECGDPSSEARYRECTLTRLVSIAAARLVDAADARRIPTGAADVAPATPGPPTFEVGQSVRVWNQYGRPTPGVVSSTSGPAAPALPYVVDIGDGRDLWCTEGALAPAESDPKPVSTYAREPEDADAI